MLEVLTVAARLYLWCVFGFLVVCLLLFIRLLIKESNKPDAPYTAYRKKQREEQRAANNHYEDVKHHNRMARLKHWEEDNGVLSPFKTVLVFIIVGLIGWVLKYV